MTLCINMSTNHAMNKYKWHDNQQENGQINQNKGGVSNMVIYFCKPIKH